jgi:hypothetical protein
MSDPLKLAARYCERPDGTRPANAAALSVRIRAVLGSPSPSSASPRLLAPWTHRLGCSLPGRCHISCQTAIPVSRSSVLAASIPSHICKAACPDYFVRTRLHLASWFGWLSRYCADVAHRRDCSRSTGPEYRRRPGFAMLPGLVTPALKTSF